MRLAYADPPYPGKAHLYPENTEVDHAELIARLCEYDGWALSTDERNLQGVLALCPAGVRVLAWCRQNAAPLLPNPLASWEPVIVSPARTRGVDLVRSYLLDYAPFGAHAEKQITGQKTRGFCEWVARALGASEGDTLADLYPGSGVMGETFKRVLAQPSLFMLPVHRQSPRTRGHIVRRSHDPLPGMTAPISVLMADEGKPAPLDPTPEKP